MDDLDGGPANATSAVERAEAFIRESKHALAVQGVRSATPSVQTVIEEDGLSGGAWWSTRNAMTMCSVVLIFGVVVIGFSALLALKKLDKDTVLKVVVIPMAVVSAVFLVVAGYSDSQVAPVMGLLGTVVGYVLGTARTSEPQPARSKRPSSASDTATDDSEPVRDRSS